MSWPGSIDNTCLARQILYWNIVLPALELHWTLVGMADLAMLACQCKSYIGILCFQHLYYIGLKLAWQHWQYCHAQCKSDIGILCFQHCYHIGLKLAWQLWQYWHANATFTLGLSYWNIVIPTLVLHWTNVDILLALACFKHWYYIGP